MNNKPLQKFFTNEMERKMKKLNIIALVGLTLLFVVDCSRHTYEPELANGRVVGSIHGIVTDFATNTRFDINQVKITWIIDGKMQSTWNDSMGYYIITDLTSGEYDITFSGADDYAVSKLHVIIPPFEDLVGCCGATDKNYSYSVIKDIMLYQMNSSLVGKIYKKESEQNIEPAEGVTVVADFTYGHESEEFYNITPAQYTAVTNSDGEFSLVELPCTPTVGLRTMPYQDDTYDYAVAETTVALIPNATKNVGDVILTIAPAEPFIVQNNFIDVDNFALTNSLTATFSKAMDTTSFHIVLKRLYQYDPYTCCDDDDYNEYDEDVVIECNVTWGSNITVTINPYVDLEAGWVYSICLEGYSLDKNVFGKEYNFKTQRGIEFVSTNLERAQDIYDEFPVDSNIEIVFSMGVVLGNPMGYVQLFDSSGAYVMTSLTLSANSKTLIINPQDGLEPDQEYHLEYRVYSSIPGDFDEGEFDFETESEITAPGQVTGFALNEPTGWHADWNTTAINFRWIRVAGAEGYVIFAKDNNHNDDRIAIGQFDAIDNVSWQYGSIALPPQFDYYDDDAWQTPFLYNTDVTFTVLAYNSAGIGPFSSEIVIGDDTTPIGTLVQNGSLDNSANGSTISVTMTFTGNEYLGSSITTSIMEAGGDVAYVLPIGNFVYGWNNNMWGGTFTVTVPANQNGSGDTFTINFQDTNGNGRTLIHTLW